MKNFLRIMGMLVGVSMIVFGIVTWVGAEYYTSINSADYASFGADFYTYIYRATRAAALNTAEIGDTLDKLAETLTTAIGFMFICAGITEICYFGSKIEKKEKKVVISVAEACCVEDNNKVEAVSEEDNRNEASISESISE